MDDIADKVDNVKITPSLLSISMMTLQKNVTQMLKTVFCKNIAKILQTLFWKHFARIILQKNSKILQTLFEENVAGIILQG